MCGPTRVTTIDRAALLMVKHYGADAVAEAARRADELDQDGDPEGCATWCRIWDAIGQLQVRKPAEARWC